MHNHPSNPDFQKVSPKPEVPSRKTKLSLIGLGAVGIVLAMPSIASAHPCTTTTVPKVTTTTVRPPCSTTTTTQRPSVSTTLKPSPSTSTTLVPVTTVTTVRNGPSVIGAVSTTTSTPPTTEIKADDSINRPHIAQPVVITRAVQQTPVKELPHTGAYTWRLVGLGSALGLLGAALVGTGRKLRLTK